MPPVKKKKTTRTSKPEVEANVKIEGSEDVVVAAGNKNFAANVKIIFQGGWKPFVAVLSIVAVLLFVILWYIIPKKDKIMTGQFNVAVAGFVVQDGNGKSIRSEDGRLLGDYLSRQIQVQFQEAQFGELGIKVWGPENTGVITGQTADERRLDAEALANRIHAHVLIYGMIISNGDTSRVTPEFYVSHNSFKDASEITGNHELGKQLKINLPFDESIQPIENPALAGRVHALNLITIGLAYYSMDDFEHAISFFKDAALEERWVGSGKEVAYLLVGNAYVRQMSKTQDPSALSQASLNYKEALRNNSNYGRAMIGQANTLYLGASVDRNNCNLDGFNQASALLDKALALQEQPASANIETKVHFYHGQISLLRNQCEPGSENWLDISKKEFTWVIEQYEARKEKKDASFQEIESLASLAYARLSYIAYKSNEADTAIDWIQKAIPIASPFYQGVHTAFLGDIYAAIGQKEQAIQAYNDAIDIAEQNGDAESLIRYQQRLGTISGN